jgi:hypothetical protein
MRRLLLISPAFPLPLASTVVWRLRRDLLAASLCVWTVQGQKAGLWLLVGSLRIVLAVCIFYDFFGLRTQRKVLSLSKLREDPDFAASSASSAVKI